MLQIDHLYSINIILLSIIIYKYNYINLQRNLNKYIKTLLMKFMTDIYIFQ